RRSSELVDGGAVGLGRVAVVDDDADGAGVLRVEDLEAELAVAALDERDVAGDLVLVGEDVTAEPGPGREAALEVLNGDDGDGRGVGRERRAEGGLRVRSEEHTS